MADEVQFEDLFGEYDDKGGVLREPKVCAVTGRSLRASHPTVRHGVTGTRYFVRSIGSNRLTDERRTELLAIKPSSARVERPGRKADEGEAVNNG